MNQNHRIRENFAIPLCSLHLFVKKLCRFGVKMGTTYVNMVTNYLLVYIA